MVIFGNLLQSFAPPFLVFKCEEDKQNAISRGGKLANIINSCNEFIHINNLTEELPGPNQERKYYSIWKKRKSYQPKFLSKFCKTIDEFYLLVEEINQGINANISALNNNVESMKNFISERKELVEKVKEQKRKL